VSRHIQKIQRVFAVAPRDAFSDGVQFEALRAPGRFQLRIAGKTLVQKVDDPRNKGCPDLPRRQGPEGRLPNVSPAREGWDIDDQYTERRRRGTFLTRTLVWDRTIFFCLRCCRQHLLSGNRDQQARTHPDRFLMIPSEAVVKGRFEKPAEAMLGGWPEHEVTGYLAGDRIGSLSVLPGVHPFRAHSQHELCFAGERPGFFEQQVCIPFGGVVGKKGRHAYLQLQPVLYRCRFGGEVRRKGGRTSDHIPTRGRTNLKNTGWIFLLGCHLRTTWVLA
jgi:hypothetical protein